MLPKLNLTTLKELDILAFGKRMRIVDAIGGLCLPNSEPSSPKHDDWEFQSYDTGGGMAD
ncbi:hypothetical protein FRB97_001818, partial [Tulasnella sp. 331]